jgi:hypothetical protein
MHPANPTSEAHWAAFYRVAGGAALLIVLVGILDIVLSLFAGDARANSVISVTEWFALFQSRPVTALSNLGLINILTLSLGIPLYLALYNAHLRTSPGFAALAANLFFIGVAVYLASNTVFTMLTLSRQYAAAPQAEKALLEAAGRAALAQGADLTPGTLLGLCFAQLGGFIMALVLQHGKRFGQRAPWLGLFGFGCMLIFFPLAAFWPEQFNLAMLISLFGGLALMAYHILIARQLFQAAAAAEKPGA